MDLARAASGACLLALGVASLALTSRVSAAPTEYFVVNTQFAPGHSTVVDAAGRFAGCRQVRELNPHVLAAGPVRFFGDKELDCGPEATVVMEYDVRFDRATGVTAGTWEVVSSTLDGIEVGDHGSLVGDPGACTVAREAGGCILDRFVLTS